MAHRRYQRDRAGSRGPDHDFFIKAPKILDRAAAPCHDDQIRSRQGAAHGHGIEPVDRGGNLGRAFGPLHSHRPDQNLARKPVPQAVQDVADHSARGRGDDADHLWQIGQRPLQGGIKQTFGGQGSTTLFQHRHQGTSPCGLNIVNDHLITGLTGKGRQTTGGNHFHPLLGTVGQTGGLTLPDDTGQDGPIILKIKIQMA